MPGRPGPSVDSFLIDHFAGKSTGSVIRAKHANLAVRLASTPGSHTWQSRAQATVHSGHCRLERPSIRGFNARLQKLPEIGTGRLRFDHVSMQRGRATQVMTVALASHTMHGGSAAAYAADGANSAEQSTATMPRATSVRGVRSSSDARRVTLSSMNLAGLTDMIKLRR